MTTFVDMPERLLVALQERSVARDWPKKADQEREGSKIHTALPKEMGVGRKDLVIIDARNVSRYSQRTDVIQLRFAYDQLLTQAIRDEIEEAWFDKGSLSWRIPFDALDDELVTVLADILTIRFPALLVMGPDIALSSTKVASLAEHCGYEAEIPDIAFKPLPFHVSTSFTEVVNAIHERRADPIVGIYVQDGDQFVRWREEEGPIYTRMPFLLIRYSTNGKPRYVEYSTLSKKVIDVEFHADRGASRLISIYKNTCAAHRIGPAFEKLPEIGGLQVIEATPEALAAYRNVPKRLQDRVNALAEARKIPFAPFLLTSDYVTLSDPTGGSQMGEHGILAYVRRGGNDGHLSGVARFFDSSLDEKVPVVIFAAGTLSDLENKEIEKFDELFAHELAHLLADARAAEFDRDPPAHSIEWAIYNRMLDIELGLPVGFYLSIYPDENNLTKDDAITLDAAIGMTLTESFQPGDWHNQSDQAYYACIEFLSCVLTGNMKVVCQLPGRPFRGLEPGEVRLDHGHHYAQIDFRLTDKEAEQLRVGLPVYAVTECDQVSITNLISGVYAALSVKPDEISIYKDTVIHTVMYCARLGQLFMAPIQFGDAKDAPWLNVNARLSGNTLTLWHGHSPRACGPSLPMAALADWRIRYLTEASKIPLADLEDTFIDGEWDISIAARSVQRLLASDFKVGEAFLTQEILAALNEAAAEPRPLAGLQS